MKVPPDFKANLDLAESIKRFRSDSSSDSKTRFFRDLKEARLLVPCKGDASHVAILNTPQGEGFLPAFSCVRELQKGDFPCEDTAVLFLDDLKHLLVDLPALTGVVIDPFGKALLLQRAQLAEMDSQLEGMTLQRAVHRKPQLLTACRDYPVGLPSALKYFLMARSEVRRVWLLSARQEPGLTSHKLFLIDFAGDRKVLFPSFAKTVQPFMRPGESFELMQATRDLLQQAERISQPIYNKK